MPEVTETQTQPASDTTGPKPDIGDEYEFLSEARRLYDFDIACDQIDREAAQSDNTFANASDSDTGQWDPVALKMRRTPGAERPVQQWNRIPTYVQQVVNDGRQNKPSIKITAADGGKKETADYFQDRIRHIEYESNADTAYDTARDQQVTSGRGFVRVDTEWIPGTWKQRICILPIENQFSVVVDAASKLYDCSDAERMFVVSRISRDKFIREYGKDKLASQSDFVTGPDNVAPTWIGVGDTGDLIQVAEYWRKIYKKRPLCSVLGLPVWRDALTDEQYKSFKDGGQIWGERMEDDAEIWQFIIDGAEILKPPVRWLGSTIPIVPFWGRIAVVDGVRRRFSLIHNAKDPQRLVNLYVSNIAEVIAQMPKTPYLAPIGGIAAQHEDDWANVGVSPKGFLYYIQHGADGKEYNMPSRVIQEPPIQALTIGLQQAIEGIKSAMGIYDASLGARSNETSGVAIDQRRKSAEVVNFHFPDNEARSRKRIGEILIEIIPQIDKPGSAPPIRTEDGKARNVPIGREFTDPKGNKVTHILTDGDYSINVSTGPSYLSARKESFQRDIEMVQADPTLLWVIGDQMMAKDDAPGSDERAERMRRAINLKTPGLIPEDAEQQQMPPQVQQEIMNSKKEAADAKAFAQSLHEQLQTKQPEIQSQQQMNSAKLSSDQQIKAMELAAEREKFMSDAELRKYICDQQEETKRTLGLATVDQADAIALLKEELGALKLQVTHTHERVMQQAEHEHQKAQTDQQIQADAEQQEQAQGHEATQADADRTHESEEASQEREHAAEQSDADREAAAEQAAQAAKAKASKPQGGE